MIYSKLHNFEFSPKWACGFAMVLTSLIWGLLAARDVQAQDVIRIFQPHSALDQRHLYNNALLKLALEKTKPHYGNFDIVFTLQGTQRNRALVEIMSGRRVNVHIVPTRPEWEEKTLPIRIPVLKGLLGYRLFLIKRHDIEKFGNIESLDQLKRLKAGLHQQWSTTEAMARLGFQIVTGSNYEGLFTMLMADRFDYFPRGVNEIFREYNERFHHLPDMVIEPRLALCLPQPTYIFVSKKSPRLAQRIEAGLHHMILDGSFERLFRAYHESSLEQAGLANRKIFRVDNPMLSKDTPLEDEALWIGQGNRIDSSSSETNLCETQD